MQHIGKLGRKWEIGCIREEYSAYPSRRDLQQQKWKE